MDTEDKVLDLIVGRIWRARKKIEGSCWQLFHDEVEHPDLTTGSAHSPYAARLVMESTLSKRWVVTPDVIAVAELVLDYLEFHASSRYPNSQEFSKRLHFSDEKFAAFHHEMGPICLTGLSGVGKSTLLEILILSLDSGENEVVIPAGAFPLKSIDRLNIGKSTMASTIVKQSNIFHRGLHKAGYSDISAYTRAAFSAGLLGFCLDEFQFTTQSSTANARVTSILLGLREYGIPWIYVSNYSLLWKLVGRNQEDRARLLTNIIHVSPLRRDTKYISLYLGALLQGLEHVFEVGDPAFCNAVYRRSAGIGRYIVELLSAAYSISRKSKKETLVGSAEIEQAYKSSLYANQRGDVESLGTTTESRKRNGKKDLVYPEQLSSSIGFAGIDEAKLTQEVYLASLPKSEQAAAKKAGIKAKPHVVLVGKRPTDADLARALDEL